jgi:hypothetical protein
LPDKDASSGVVRGEARIGDPEVNKGLIYQVGKATTFEAMVQAQGLPGDKGPSAEGTHAEGNAMETARQASATAKVVKISANLPAASLSDLRKIAESRGVTLTEALRRSIGTAKFLMDAMDAGGKVLIEDASRRTRQIVLL